MSARSDEQQLQRLIATLPPSAVALALDSLPEVIIPTLLSDLGGAKVTCPPDPLAQAMELDPHHRTRPHLTYLSSRLARAVADVEGGQSRMMAVSMPPRLGKSQLTSVDFPTWLLRKNPKWKLGLVSHSPDLAKMWGKQVRRKIEAGGLGVSIAPDAGAVAGWETTEGGSVFSRSVNQSVTGLGFKVLLIDDPVKDVVTAHSAAARKHLWEWWEAVAQTRLEPPSLVVIIGTRWHEDDIIGRVRSTEWSGDPDDWEIISFPAVAVQDDVLGRAPGEPLLSPLLNESAGEAVERWAKTRRNVGEYTWAALYQQSPSPAKGAVFSMDWWRFWTSNPANATPDGRVVYVDPDSPWQLPDGSSPLPDWWVPPETDPLAVDPDPDVAARLTELLAAEPVRRPGEWLDSWDMAFKATHTSDYVVGQRWLRRGPFAYLIAQTRARLTFTETVTRVVDFSTGPGWLGAGKVRRVLIEDKANGTAILDVLRQELSGLIAVSPKDPKIVRARAVSPTVESGNVRLPFPGDPGNEWVTVLLTELKEFPTGANDDQVDALVQALMDLGGPVPVGGGVAVDPDEVIRAQGLVPGVGASTGVRPPVGLPGGRGSGLVPGVPGVGGLGGPRGPVRRRFNPGRPPGS